MILTELLSIAEKKNLSLYLDIKVPCPRSLNDEDCYRYDEPLNDSSKIEYDLINMINILRPYLYSNPNIIDCIISFDRSASIIINRLIKQYNLPGDIGVFCWEKYDDIHTNKRYIADSLQKTLHALSINCICF
jgi:hypothetical protein